MCLFILIFVCICILYGCVRWGGAFQQLTWSSSRDISVYQFPTRLGYPSFTVEKHQHSNPGKAASEAGSDIYSNKSHRRIGYLVAWTNAETTKMGACC